MIIASRTLVFIIALASTLFVVCGCAGSNASRASLDTNRTLSLGQIESKAADLVADIVANPRFVKYRKALQGGNGQSADIVMLVQNIDGTATNDREWPTMLESLLASLEGSLAAQGLSFSQDLDPGLPNYVKGIEEFDKQDSDARYNQTTGTVTTGAAHKAVLGLVLTATKQELGNQVEIMLRAKVVDGESKTTLLVASSLTKNPASERK